MKARISKKIIKIWCKGCDKRFFEKDGEIKEDKVSFFVHLYRKAVLKRNKMNYPGSSMKMPMATDGVLSSMWLRNAVTGVKESSSSKRKHYV